MRKSLLCAVFLFGCLFFVFAQKQVRAQPSSQPQQQFPFLARVEKKNVNIRAGQDINFEKIGRLQKGEKVVVLGKSYSWYKIRLPVHADSHIRADLVKMFENGIGEITGNRVNVRARASVSSAILGQLRKGELIRVLGESKGSPLPPPDSVGIGTEQGSPLQSATAEQGWYRIEPHGKIYGWVLSKYLTVTAKNIPAGGVISRPDSEAENKKNLFIKRMKQQALKRIMDKAKKKVLENAN